ncbi:LD-carboxypeptidase [Microtetraspora sp. NBRC 16547]|uniref:S66 peptidase family protein n=1 Tax=Microtetraspora sp. NBRC 16547 TaxID=3030993 RepID=UPI0024A3D906|nr:LD-carboxypeptidase [Microtetraspora sp. NBRC 16547]GLX02547.1 putative carboxypeptidase [Microtetraspora sp. NBRC 16547]
MTDFLHPPALRPGARVAVIAASSPPNQANLDRGLAAMEEVGLKPEVFASSRVGGTEYDYLAGDDVLRASDLTKALGDPAFDAVFCAGGGYGMQRTLELVDWSKIDATKPKVVVGYSDVTALLEAIAVKLGWVSLFGPMVACDGFYQGPGEYDFDELMKLLFHPETVTELVFPDARTVVPGIAEGHTLGGTATLLAASLGTDTSLPARGAILFLEDVDEELFRMDRYITQLRRATYSDGVAGILLGTFTNCGEPRDVERMLVERLSDLGVPVLAGADIGHGISMQTYPIGVKAQLDTEAGKLRFLEPILTS